MICTHPDFAALSKAAEHRSALGCSPDGGKLRGSISRSCGFIRLSRKAFSRLQWEMWLCLWPSKAKVSTPQLIRLLGTFVGAAKCQAAGVRSQLARALLPAGARAALDLGD